MNEPGARDRMVTKVFYIVPSDRATRHARIGLSLAGFGDGGVPDRRAEGKEGGDAMS